MTSLNGWVDKWGRNFGTPLRVVHLIIFQIVANKRSDTTYERPGKSVTNFYLVVFNIAMYFSYSALIDHGVGTTLLKALFACSYGHSNTSAKFADYYAFLCDNRLETFRWKVLEWAANWFLFWARFALIKAGELSWPLSGLFWFLDKLLLESLLCSGRQWSVFRSLAGLEIPFAGFMSILCWIQSNLFRYDEKKPSDP